MRPPQFTDDQVARLRNIGVTVDQRRRLIESALPAIVQIDAGEPRLDDVRGVVDDLQRALEDAHRQLARLVRAQGDDERYLIEARVRIQCAAAGIDRDDRWRDDLKICADALGAALAVTKVAREEFPPGQRRRNEASSLPIWAIYRSLAVSVRASEVPAFMRQPSGNAFREIVGVCYEAALGKERDPERAIKAFARQRREQDRQRAAGRDDPASWDDRSSEF